MSDSSFVKINDMTHVINHLSSIKDSALPILIWKIIGDTKYIAGIKIEAVRKTRNDFIVTPSEDDVSKVQDLMGVHNYIDLYVPEHALIFRCNVRQTEAPLRYYLEVPEFMAQVERRKSLRLDLSSSNEVTIKFSKNQQIQNSTQQKFQKSCYDISSGGFSFLVSRVESKFFKINDLIRTVEISTAQWKSTLTVQVSLVKEVGPDENTDLSYKAWRVSCRFMDIDDISKKYLDKFVFERLKPKDHAINF